MRPALAFALLITGCSTPEPDTQPDTSVADPLCDTEARLAGEQQALGLSMDAVCDDLVPLDATTLVQAGLLRDDVDMADVLSPDALVHRAEFEGPRTLYAFDGITLSVANDDEQGMELAILTAQAWRRLQSLDDASAFVASLSTAPAGAPLPCCAWTNAVDHLVVSLDATPRDIGASVTIVGPADTSEGLDHYANTALLSIDRETVLGSDDALGSGAIYGAASPRENMLRYFADGALFTLVHEATHLTIDHRNAVSVVANRIWDGRTLANGAYVSAEEVVSNYTACTLLVAELSDEMLVANRAIQTHLRSLQGTDERIEELRTYEDAATVIDLTASPVCGGE